MRRNRTLSILRQRRERENDSFYFFYISVKEKDKKRGEAYYLFFFFLINWSYFTMILLYMEPYFISLKFLWEKNLGLI
jgi:hypothetical protein